MTARRFESFDPDIPDGLQVEVFDPEPLPDADREALHGMIATGNKLIAAYNAATIADPEVAAAEAAIWRDRALVVRNADAESSREIPSRCGECGGELRDHICADCGTRHGRW